MGGGAAVALSVGAAGSPSNTMSPGPRSTSVPSGGTARRSMSLDILSTAAGLSEKSYLKMLANVQWP